ncbi:MAG TPA: SDR family oxidoreductase [Burkholderiaceae bacterium]|nr:SDR family oxidoreductase [Burkholderiaceae bacterium]
MTQRKTAIVTGSGTGVGAATALALAQRGYDVLINYSKSEREARESEAACRAAGADTLLVQGDVADDAACRALADAALARWQRLDALVNNAGITAFKGSGNWDAIDAADFQRIIAVNAMGTFQMVRACAPHLRATRGAIVNVSSIAGALGIGSSVPYIASKGAVNAMTLHFARTLAPHVRVNAVCPGLITTRWFVDGMGRDSYERIKANYEQTTPLQTAASADDVADAVVWLIEGARTTTGELLMLDGGRHLGGTVAVPPRS